MKLSSMIYMALLTGCIIQILRVVLDRVSVRLGVDVVYLLAVVAAVAATIIYRRSMKAKI